MHVSIRILALVLGSSSVVTACASHDAEPETQTPRAAIELRATIASVQLAQDCPDPPPAPSPASPITPAKERAAESPAVSAQRAAPGAAVPGGGGWSPPCTQSTMQLELAHDGPETLPIEVMAVRMQAVVKGKGPHWSVPYRVPSRWTDNKYEPWDQRLAPGAPLKVSYKLGEPDWSSVTKDLGNPDTFGVHYTLEVDLVFDGRTITVRSQPFEREQPHVIVT